MKTKELKNWNTEMYSFSCAIEDEDGEKNYVIRFDGIPNAIGVGETFDEAYNDAQEALATLFDLYEENGHEIPKPIIKNPAKEPSGRLTLRMPKNLHSTMIKLAEYEDISLNSLVIDAISSYVYKKDVAIKIVMRQQGKQLEPTYTQDKTLYSNDFSSRGSAYSLNDDHNLAFAI